MLTRAHPFMVHALIHAGQGYTWAAFKVHPLSVATLTTLLCRSVVDKQERTRAHNGRTIIPWARVHNGHGGRSRN